MNSTKPAAGFSMLEVIISLLVLGVAITGFLLLEQKKLVRTVTVKQKISADLALLDLAERVIANPAGGNFYSSYAAGDSADCINQNCTPAEIAKFDMARIISRIKSVLPGVELTVSADSPDSYLLTVSWQGTGGNLSSGLIVYPPQ